MTRLMLILFSMALTTLAGAVIVAALVSGSEALGPVMIAALLGAFLTFLVNARLAQAIS